jgi:transcriptional regulator EpsA
MNTVTTNRPVEPAPAPAPAIESMYLDPAQAQALLRLVETAPAVRRRSHFFVWLQSHAQTLLPHKVAVCGAWNRHRRQVEFDVFNSIALSPTLMSALAGSSPPLMTAFTRHWIEGDGRPFLMTLASDAPRELGPAVDEMQRAGLSHVAVHGVSRPERRHEIESLFLLAGGGGTALGSLLQTIELLIPHLHATYLRAQGLERELAAQPSAPAASSTAARRPAVTARERQILHWVREGMSNHEIGAVLGISALTVKNHVQKILRKLGASNRAQAVAMALQSRLITGHGGEFDREAAEAGTDGAKR